MNVFHFVHAYLFPTENWCYQIIKNTPDANLAIVSEQLNHPGAFPLPNARFFIPPFATDRSSWPTMLRRAHTAARLVCTPVWRSHLQREARKADVFHAHFSIMGWQYLQLAERTRKPLIVSFYGYDYEWIPKNRPEWVERYRILFEKAALFVTEGVAGRDKLLKQGCRPDKIRVAHLGVDVERIPFFERMKAEKELKLVQVASMTPKKGHETTVRAFARAAPDCPGTTLTLVGKDHHGIRAGLERELKEAGVFDRVHFVDFVPVAQLHSFLRDYHFFIHPSRHSASGDSEGGAPIVLLDAQATGMPVLSTRHCDIPEEVIEGETGFLVDEGDDVALAETIRRAYEMGPERYSAMARNARRHVETNYEVKACGRHLRAVYAEVLEALPPASRVA